MHREGWARRVWRRLSRHPARSLGVGLALLLFAVSGATAALAYTVVSQRATAQRAERLRILSQEVIARSELLDARFARAAELAEGVAMAAATLHLGDAPVDGPTPYGATGPLASGPGPHFDDLVEVDGYDFPISYERPMFHWPATTDERAGRRHLAVMRPLAAHLKGGFFRSLDEGAMTWPEARQRAALEAGEVPLWALYVAFADDGLMLSYPGWIPLGEGYDARRRPWYTHVADRSGVRFGYPYIDAAGGALIIPCNRAMRTPDGRFLGVAGADYTLDDLAEVMRIDDPTWRRSSLVDAEAREIVNTDQRGVRLETHDRSAESGVPLPPELAAELRDARSGWVQLEDELVIFDALEEPGWTFVAHFD